MSEPSDFYEVERLLDAGERDLLHTVRKTLRATVTPMVNEYWTWAEFPHEIIPVLRDLGIASLPYAGIGRRDGSPLRDGLIFAEIAAVDPSIATFHGVHSGLATTRSRASWSRRTPQGSAPASSKTRSPCASSRTPRSPSTTCGCRRRTGCRAPTPSATPRRCCA